MLKRATDSRWARLLVATSLITATVAIAHGESSAAVAPRAVQSTLGAGNNHSLVVREDGSLWTFGRNQYGQLGYATNSGTDTPNPTPQQVLTDVVAVAAGGAHSMALKADGTLWTFGSNEYGQLGWGDVDTDPNNVPTQMMTGVAAIAAGNDFSYALKTDGTLWTFGRNYWGQLGNATSNLSNAGNVTPTQVLTGVAAIAAGGFHGLALKTDGTVLSFGRNLYGQLGHTENTHPNPTPFAVDGLTDVVAIAAGDSHSMALESDGSLWTFGYDGYGQLGDGLNGGIDPYPTPTQVLAGVTSIAAFGDQGFALKADGTLWSFGYNQYGHLGHTGGNGGSSGQPTPTNVLSDVTEVASGYSHTLALKTDGTVFTFGADFYGQLGDGSYLPADPDANPTPTAIALDDALQPDSYVSLVPGRLMDTRVPASPTVDGLFEATGLRTANSTTALEVAGRGGVPLDSDAVSLNVTVTGAQADGYLSVYPCGTSVPNVSNLNFSAGDTIPNSVVVKLGVGSKGVQGHVCLFTSANAHVIVDVAGFFPATSTYVAIGPDRIMDTRPGGVGPLGVRVATTSTDLVPSVPNDAVAVVLNVTAVAPLTDGYITVFPCGTTPPNSSNLNFVAGQTIPNLVISKLGVDGKVCVFTSATTHVIADISGYIPASSTFHALAPGRMIDTRAGGQTVDDLFEGIGVRTAGSTTELVVNDRGNVPKYASTVVLNVTVTAALSDGYVTVYPCGSPMPNASNLNFTSGDTIPNLVISKVGSDGKVCIFTSAPTHLIADVSGYFDGFPPTP